MALPYAIYTMALEEASISAIQCTSATSARRPVLGGPELQQSKCEG